MSLQRNILLQLMLSLLIGFIIIISDSNAFQSFGKFCEYRYQSTLHLAKNEPERILSSKQAPQIIDDQIFEPSKNDDRIPLQNLKTGDPLIGAVVDVTNFGAFLDCGIGRVGKAGRQVRVLGLLHKSDVDSDYLLAGQFFSGKKDATVIRKGEHIQVYVKGVFKQSARFTLTMDPTVDKEKVAEERQKNKKVQMLRRRIKDMKDVKIGEIIMGEVKRVKEFGAFIDVGAQKSSLLSKDCIRKIVSKDFTDAREVLKPDDQVKVRVLSNEGSLIKLELLEIQSDGRTLVQESEYEYYA
mmetsp:Transcript_40959/g.52757  ORF Transcript_40959/g.52757 Transcript_40959/m.52757 type:complete len:297 (-) Transcript_40959:269-1159(-)